MFNLLSFGTNSRSSSSSVDSTCLNKILSYSYARDFIKGKLKSPSTADFPSFSKISYSYLGDCRHNLVGYVDAQNSFGAVIRNNFNVTVKYRQSDKTYILEKISLK